MARLIIIDGPDRGKEFELDPTEKSSQVAGRDPRLSIAIHDTTVSREHFRVDRLGNGYRLVDLGSRNRTFLNGEPIRDNLLRNGDVIAVGDSELRFEDSSESLEVAEMSSTIIKEVASADGESMTSLIDSLRDDPTLREERLRRAVEGLRQLFTLSREILRSTSLDELYGKLLEILIPALGGDRGVVLHQADGTWKPRSVYTSPSYPGSNSGEDRPKEPSSATSAPDGDLILVSETVIQRVAEEKKALLSEHTPSDSRFQNGQSIIEGEITTVIAAPILVPATNRQHRVAGVLYSDRRGAKSPFSEKELRLLSAAAEQAGDIVAHIESQAELRDSNRTLIRSIVDSKRIIGDSESMRLIHAFIRKAAPTPFTVLIRGETGTGKELVASAIHYQSPRQGKSFVAINCAAIPENLIESELFGYEKGAFTSASSRKKGRFELADQGTIFLDELAELSLSCQAKLLRLLEEQRFERVGGTQTVEVDVRIIAATNKDLAAAVADGKFREDLFYRLNVLTVQIPPLRERPEDILLIVRHFLSEMGLSEENKRLSPEAEKKLLSYHWPGNIRQLRNVIESAIVLGEGPTILPDDLILGGPQKPEPGDAASWQWQPASLEEVQKKHIEKVLQHTGGNKKKAAEILGIERCTLYAKLKNYGINQKDQKG